MPDFIHELPFSWRPQRDESAVSSDWGPELAVVLTTAAELIDQQLTEASQADLWSGPFLAAARIELPDGEPASTAAIRASAGALESGRRVSIKRLDRAVYAYLDLCERLESVPTLEATTSGAVALARAASAPTPIRAVIAGHSIRATDAGWSFGSGPELQAAAVELLQFLGNRSLQAPRPAPAT
jgi:hypothetical protein